MPTGSIKRNDDLPRFYTPVKSRHGDSSYRWPLRRSRTLAILGVLLLYLLYRNLWSSSSDSDYAPDGTKWSQYAYSLYATDGAALCHCVLVFDALKRFGSKADRVLFYPEYWDTEVYNSRDRDSQLLVMARDVYKVKLQPVKLLSVEALKEANVPKTTWDNSVTKFLAFGLTQYKRVLHLDSDITLLQPLDELFLLPPTPIAMPRAYWTVYKPWPLTSLLMLLTPNARELDAFKALIAAGAAADVVTARRYDMDLVNDRFGDSALVLPHRPYALLSGEFRAHNHSRYLGNGYEAWDADAALREAKLVHFSDWPLPKPWVMWPLDGLAAMQPDCGGSHEGTCRDRVVWKELYDGFRQRRRDVCRLLSVPAPEWASIVGQKEGEKGNATEVEAKGVVVEDKGAEVEAKGIETEEKSTVVEEKGV
ncbi:nucleotide-diphospho-sugar transferase [Mytilinidion resinicola]|uniref:Nucleotide-diphospho-sugar transferase n=1 Tax=Mytilinidion resinicola TaxID=574789 RepID=A0A6A6Z2C0_9PEZI|nr:nucleotide-diphospho-sugar transferase [Mytilinidion resinicola]KAF2815150.1 nucleotide-diphospho-sugar transferase [Mytilinidion resinicola]